jgi:hypothetical protein
MSNGIMMDQHAVIISVENAVRAAVAREACIPATEINPDVYLVAHPQIGAGGFYRIIVDIEQA